MIYTPPIIHKTWYYCNDHLEVIKLIDAMYVTTIERLFIEKGFISVRGGYNPWDLHLFRSLPVHDPLRKSIESW